MGVTDLNMRERIGEAAGFDSREHAHVCRQDGLLPIDGSPAAAHVPAMRHPLSRQVSVAVVLPSRSVLAMAFAQLTLRESLRAIETCLRAHTSKLYHLGIRGRIARSTLADANEKRDWRIYCDFALSLIHVARQLYAGDTFGAELENTAYAFDTTTINLCLSLFPWARFC